VLIGGSGPATREPLQKFVELLVDDGVTTLAYDKRGTGKSMGDWTTASLDDLAGDAIAAIALLRSRSDVDSARIGVWAISQGGWIVPVVASRVRLAFAIIVTGGGVAPIALERASYAAALERAGVPMNERATARSLVERYLEYLRDGRGYEEIRRALVEAGDAPWVNALGLQRVLPNPGAQPKWNWVATFDPLPLIARMNMPTLVLLGSRDLLAKEAADAWREGFARGGNRQAEVVVVPGAAHALQRDHRLGASPVAEYNEHVRSFLDRFVLSARRPE
jgi:pimeloyl-ACP methyl ester carboxylesterase